MNSAAKPKNTTEALASLESFIDDWRNELNVDAQPKAKKFHARYTAKKELLAIQEYYLKLEGRKLTAGEIIDLALEQHADDIGSHYALDEED